MAASSARKMIALRDAPHTTGQPKCLSRIFVWLRGCTNSTRSGLIRIPVPSRAMVSTHAKQCSTRTAGSMPTASDQRNWIGGRCLDHCAVHVSDGRVQLMLCKRSRDDSRADGVDTSATLAPTDAGCLYTQVVCALGDDVRHHRVRNCFRPKERQLQ